MKFFSALAWKVAAVILTVVVCAGLWLRGDYYAARARTSETLLKGAVAVGNANAEIARAHASLASRIDAVGAVAAIRKRRLRTISDTRRKAIIHAPADTDGPLAPVLRDQLDRLPESPSADPRRGTAAAGDSIVVAVGQ